MFNKITTCATALTLLIMTPAVQANAEEKTVNIDVNGQNTPLSLNEETAQEDVKQILGDAWYYGVTADTFHFDGESETNFAVKSLDHQNGTGGQTGVTDKGQGSKKAFFIAGSVDSPFMIKGIEAEVMSPESEKDKFQNAGSFIQEDANDIDAYIDAMEDYVTEQSECLSQMDSVTGYDEVQGNGKITIDVTQAGDHTVYINVDQLPSLISQFQQSSGVTLVKNAGQKVVFNFNNDSSVTLQKMVVRTNGTDEDTTSLANHSTANGSATAMDLIFNMPEATQVTLNDSTGVFLAPNASVTSYGVDGGWLVADTFTNHCEWHFVNGNLPEEIEERTTVIEPVNPDSVLGAKRSGPVPSETPVSTPETTVKPTTPSTTPKPTEKPTVTPEPTTKPESTKPLATPKTDHTKKNTEKSSVKDEGKKPEATMPPHSSGNTEKTKEAMPVKEAKTVKGQETPDTGDHRSLTIYSVLLFAAGVLMIGVIRRMKNEEE